MQTARRLLLALAVLAPLALRSAPAAAEVVPGVVVSPSVIGPGEPLTVSGPAVSPDCLTGTVLAGTDSAEYKFAAGTNMQAPWSITSSAFRRFGVPATIAMGQYSIAIECFDGRGNQTIFTTTATLTVTTPDPKYRPVTPARLLDTRPGAITVDGEGASGGQVGPGGTRVVKVTGRGGVGSVNVKAVVLNITVTGPSVGGFVTVFPSGEPRPLASNLNFTAGRTVPNLVVAKVGVNGNVSIYNESGSTHVIADVTGWFPDSAAFTPVSPFRLLDTRPTGSTVDGIGAGGGPVGPVAVRSVKVTGRGAVPTSDVGAVVLNVTATAPTGAGYVTAYPTGEPRPNASNLNFNPGETVPNLVIAKVGTDGQVDLYNDAGSTHLVVDVAGYFPTVSSFRGLSPVRLLDTRPTGTTLDGVSAGGGAVTAGATRVLQVTGRGGVAPSGVSAVVLNITATAPTSPASFVTVHPTGEPRPNASNLNVVKDQTVANLVVAKVGPTGQVSIYNDQGTTHLIADVAGWFAG